MFICHVNRRIQKTKQVSCHNTNNNSACSPASDPIVEVVIVDVGFVVVVVVVVVVGVKDVTFTPEGTESKLVGVLKTLVKGHRNRNNIYVTLSSQLSQLNLTKNDQGCEKSDERCKVKQGQGWIDEQIIHRHLTLVRP